MKRRVFEHRAQVIADQEVLTRRWLKLGDLQPAEPNGRRVGRLAIARSFPSLQPRSTDAHPTLADAETTLGDFLFGLVKGRLVSIGAVVASHCQEGTGCSADPLSTEDQGSA